MIKFESVPCGDGFVTRVTCEPEQLTEEERSRLCRCETESCKHLRALKLMPWKLYCEEYNKVLKDIDWNKSERLQECINKDVHRVMMENRIEFKYSEI